MTSFKIYQIELTDRLSDHINATGWSDPVSKSYLDATMGKVEQAIRAGMYSHAVTIDADNLDQVFEIGNVGPEDYIQPVGRWSSVSVGNLIEDAQGVFHVVAKFGFEPLSGQLAMIVKETPRA